jgi:hypothetical protein
MRYKEVAIYRDIELSPDTRMHRSERAEDRFLQYRSDVFSHSDARILLYMPADELDWPESELNEVRVVMWR